MLQGTLLEDIGQISQPVKSPLFDLQAWVSDTHVVVGTKCNKLVCVDAVTLQMHDIILPPKPVRSEELLMASSNHPGCGIHTMAVSPDGSMLAVGGADPLDCQIMHIQHQHGKAPIFTPMQALVVELSVSSLLSFVSDGLSSC